MNPFQALYKLGLNFDRKFTTAQNLDHPVISVGNISVGGRAKTPMVIDLCLTLKREGYVPVVLTRGYARKSKVDTWLLPEALKDLQKISADDCGDEALEIYLKAEVAVLVSAKRSLQAVKYSQLFKNSKIIFVLDDGFQHWNLKRDFDLVLIAKSDHSDSLLPTGRLREGVEALARADVLLELEKDLKKVVSVQAKEKLQRGVVWAVTTRAGSQKDYAKTLSDAVGFEPSLLALKDHLHKEAFIAQLESLPATARQLLVGIKEAVKLFPPQVLLEQKVQPLSLELKSRTFEVYIVDLKLDYDRKKLSEALVKKGVIK